MYVVIGFRNSSLDPVHNLEIFKDKDLMQVYLENLVNSYKENDEYNIVEEFSNENTFYFDWEDSIDDGFTICVREVVCNDNFQQSLF